MIAFIVIILGLWIYPVLTLILLRLVKNRPKGRKIIYYTSFIMTGLALFGILTNISTTLSVIDWVLVSSIYLTMTLLLGWTQYQPKKWLEIVGIVLMFLVYGIGYLSSTAGILGVGFILDEYTPYNEIWLKDGLIYKETPLGNAVSDYRGKRVEIYKTISWLPIIEWRIQQKEYYNVLPSLKKLEVDYSEKDKKIYLKTSSEWSKDSHFETWVDTLILDR